MISCAFVSTTQSFCPCRIICRAVSSCGRSNRPSRGHLLQFEQAGSRQGDFGHAQVPDLGRTLTEASVDPIIDDQCAPDSAADGHVQEWRITDTGPEPGLRPGRRHPRRFRGRRPGRPDASSTTMRGGNRPNPILGKTFWFVRSRRRRVRRIRRRRRRSVRLESFRFASRAGKARSDLVQDTGCAAGGSTSIRSRAASVSLPLAKAELELGAADLDAQHPGFSHAITQIHPVENGRLGGEAAVEVVDDPVEDDLMQRFRRFPCRRWRRGGCGGRGT